jgi:predicted glycogen debranching enzyme
MHRAGRQVLLTQCDEMVTYDGRAYQISTTEYEDGTLAPAGYVHLAQFRIERGLPVTLYELNDTSVEKWVWMGYRRNTTYVRYRLAATARGPAELRLRPLLSDRPLHRLAPRGQDRVPVVEPLAEGCRATLDQASAPLVLRLAGGWFEPQPDWYWRVLYRRERERGHEYVEDLFAPGTLAARLAPGGEITLIISAEPTGADEVEPGAVWQLEWRRRGTLVQQARLPEQDQVGRTLVLAADALLAAWPEPAPGEATRPAGAVIAGYHWLSRGGRDALIALPGLMLATGRASEARALLGGMARLRQGGLLPVRFDEETGAPSFLSADTSLWLFVALRAYLNQTGDHSLLTDLWPVLVEIVETYERGTHYGIGVDPGDGLVRAGAPGLALTWMDARSDDQPLTPRHGKPVELNALWYNALRQMAEWSATREPERAPACAMAAQHVGANFDRHFWYAPGAYLYDVLNSETGHDLTWRPNQLLAISLPFPVLARDRRRPVLDAATDRLLTPFGMRTLSPGELNYVGWYAGDAFHRERAAHQGSVWPWLLDHYRAAYYRVYGNYGALGDRLRAFEKHLKVAGLGFISEVFDGDAPHSPQGCIAGATSVAAVFQAWRAIHEGLPVDEPPPVPRPPAPDSGAGGKA